MNSEKESNFIVNSHQIWCKQSELAKKKVNLKCIREKDCELIVNLVLKIVNSEWIREKDSVFLVKLRKNSEIIVYPRKRSPIDSEFA